MQENSETLNSRAIELATDGAYPEAVACLKRALSIDRDNYLLWFNLGVIYRNSGDLEFAKQALKKVNPNECQKLLDMQKEWAKNRFDYYSKF